MTKQEPIRVLILDGDPQVCRALVRLLKPVNDIKVVATAIDRAAALELALRLQPSVILVDVGTTDRNGMAITRTLCQQAPVTRVLALGVYATFRNQALAAGACRFLLKDCRREELVAAIRLAAQGQCQMSGEEHLGQGDER